VTPDELHRSGVELTGAVDGAPYRASAPGAGRASGVGHGRDRACRSSTGLVPRGDAADGETVKQTVVEAQGNLNDATEQQCCITELAGDKGYNKTETLVWAEERGIRTYIPEAEHHHNRRWHDKPEGWRDACYNTRRRVARDKGKAMQRTRSELVERTFAHVCETGRGRRTWIRGMVEVGKRYLMQVAAHNLGVILRKLFGVGTPRGWGSAPGKLCALFGALAAVLVAFWRSVVDFRVKIRDLAAHVEVADWSHHQPVELTASSTGC
jgi:hypothetical protein